MKSELIKFMRERVFDMTDKIPDAGEQSAFLAGGLAAVTLFAEAIIDGAESGAPKPAPQGIDDFDVKVRGAAQALCEALGNSLGAGIKPATLADDVNDFLRAAGFKIVAAT